ncbi:MAG: leucine-rich repeat domain-containing protein, partial [Spirulina sp.]
MNAATVQRNPYIVGSAISDPKCFFGRKKLFQFVEENLEKGEKVILLHGQRRIGKSSVLLQIPNFVRSDRFVFIYFDLQDKGNLHLSHVLYRLARAISKKIGDNFVFPSEADFAADPSLFSDKFLPEVYQRLEDRNIVLILDEFDVLDNYDPVSSIQTFFPYLQTLLNEHEKLFIIPAIGRQPEDLPRLLNLFRRAPTQKIGLLSVEDTERLITEPAQDILSYSQAAIRAILELSNGHPYFTQLLCFAVFMRARDGKKKQISLEDVEEIIDEAIEIGEGGLAWFRDGLTIPERVIFSAVAETWERANLRGDSSIEKPWKILKEYGIVSTESLKEAETKLIDGDFLEFAEDLNELSETPQTYRVKIELVRRWLVKHHPLQREILELEKLEPEARSKTRDEAYYEAERRIEAARQEEATELDLSDMGLTELPDAIGQLINLKILHLGEGFGEEEQKNQLVTLPESLGNLTQLQTLFLQNNQLVTLPESFGNLTQLQTLSLHNNQLGTL